MRAVIQRVSEGAVRIAGETVGEIGPGLVILLGVGLEDGPEDIRYLAEKIVHLRIFEDEAGKMNLSALDLDLELLVVSQFTLYGDCRKGRRPGFSAAAPPKEAKKLYEAFVQEIKRYGLSVATGEFQAMMDVELINSGPVTLLIDSEKIF